MDLSKEQIQILYSLKDSPQPYPINNPDVVFLSENEYIFIIPIPEKLSERDIALDITPNPTQAECSILEKGQTFLKELEREQLETDRHNENIAEAKLSNQLSKEGNDLNKEAIDISKKALKKSNSANVIAVIALVTSTLIGLYQVESIRNFIHFLLAEIF